MSALASIKSAARLAIIAEGLPIILRSAEDLVAASAALEEKQPRASNILERQAHEEAAKILILLDYARCPPGLSLRAQRQIKAFYDHSARAVYAEACRWKAYDVEMLRGYVDQTRASHIVEGDARRSILSNWEEYRREALLYADLSRSESGYVFWNDPMDWQHRDYLLPRAEEPVLKVVRALDRLGFYSTEALEIFAGIWQIHEFKSAADDSTLAQRLMEETLSAFDKLKLFAENATQADATTVYWSLPLPMYNIDVCEREVTLEALHAQQEAMFYGELGME